MKNQRKACRSGRKRWNRLSVHQLALALCFSSLVSCSSGTTAPPKKEVRRDWFYPTRQHAPEEVYNRLREVRPPEPVPRTPRRTEKAPRLFPVIQVDAKDTTLSEVARILARSYRYGHYCSPLIADRNITLRGIGTLDELADEVARLALVRVTVDHENREVRILTGLRAQTPEPQRYDAASGATLGRSEHRETGPKAGRKMVREPGR